MPILRKKAENFRNSRLLHERREDPGKNQKRVPNDAPILREVRTTETFHFGKKEEFFETMYHRDLYVTNNVY